MSALEPQDIQCPYCGEIIEVLIDPSVPQQQYIEDCQVCCRPIQFDVTVDYNGEIFVSACHEND